MTSRLLGFVLVLAMMMLFLPKLAQGAGLTPTTTLAPEINVIITAWTLIAAFVVFCMQVGFVMLEAGFA